LCTMGEAMWSRRRLSGMLYTSKPLDRLDTTIKLV
jgi:hypothetical protein